MIPTVVGIGVLGLGVLLIYAGIHGIPGLLDIQQPGAFAGVAAGTTTRPATTNQRGQQ